MTVINVSLSRDMSEKLVICELTYCTSTVPAVFPSKVSKETLPELQWLDVFNQVFALKMLQFGYKKCSKNKNIIVIIKTHTVCHTNWDSKRGLQEC